MERLATTLSGMCVELDRIRTHEIVNCGRIGAERLHIMGFCKQESEVDVASPRMQRFNRWYTETLHYTADILGVTVDRVDHDLKLTTAPTDIEISESPPNRMLVKQGTVAAMQLTHQALNLAADAAG